MRRDATLFAGLGQHEPERPIPPRVPAAVKAVDGPAEPPCSKARSQSKSVSATPDIADTRLLLTEREAAGVLAISPRKLWELRSCGEIPCVRLGKAVRYAIKDLEAWIETNKSR